MIRSFILELHSIAVYLTEYRPVKDISRVSISESGYSADIERARLRIILYGIVYVHTVGFVHF